MNKKIFFGIAILIVILFLISFSSSASSGYTRSTPSYASSAGITSSLSSTLHREMCNSGQDFIVQINPFGCTPAVVRSDLLEEQNVPVFCELGATKLNPLIDVEAIESISFSGQYPQTISGIGFHPAQSALGVKGNLNKPVLNNIGYVVIVLEKQKNSSAMPKFVQGNLTAKLKYDIKNAFGVGKSTFYLPLMDDETWEEDYKSYGFWEGRGFLRVEDIQENSAEIVLYDGELDRINSVELEKGKTSEKLSLPGFDCLANLQLKLESLENVDTYIKLKINEEVVNVKQKELFLDNKCSVTSFDEKGITQEIRLSCKTDDKTKPLELKISPKIRLSFDYGNGEEQGDYSAGDKLFESKGKSYYLGYVGTKKKSTNVENLFAVIVTYSEEQLDKLSDKDLRAAEMFVRNLEANKKGVAGVVDIVNKEIVSNARKNFESFVSDKYFDVVTLESQFENPDKIKIKLIGVGSTMDIDLNGASANEKIAKEYYDSTLSDFNRVIKSYSDEKYFDDDNLKLGEQALFEKINFSKRFDQKKTMQEYCEEFKTNYGKSTLLGNVIKICDENPFVASSPDSNQDSVLINNKVYTISFEGIYKPSKDDYSAEIYIQKNGKQMRIELGKEELYILPKDFVETKDEKPLIISLRELDIDSAKVDVNNGKRNILQTIGDWFSQDTWTLKKDVALGIGNDYVLTLTHVNLKKSAKVSVNPSIENAGTEVNFGFKIGIEKNSIELSPDKTKKLIDKLNKTITDWNEKSDKLGKAIKGFKTACLGTSAVLVVQGFFSNLGGKSISRQEIMRGAGGWYEICTQKVQEKLYSTLNECLTKNSAEIEKDVDTYYSAMKEQENKIKESEKSYQKTNGLTQERIIDDEKWAKDYFDNEWKKKVAKNLKNKFKGETMTINNEQVNIDEFVNGLDYKTSSISELRAIELNSGLSGGATLDARSSEVLKTQISTIYSNTKEINEEKRKIEELKKNSNLVDVGYKIIDPKNKIDAVYDNGKIGNTNFGDIPANSKVQKVGYKGGDYFILLNKGSGNKYGVEEVYDSDGKKVDTTSGVPRELKENLILTAYDENSYKNPFKNVVGSTTPIVKYYETEPYKGLPAIVPFDLQNGWYASTKQTLPSLGGIKPVDASGRLTSFYVCNVGIDGIASGPDSSTSDDICEMVNLATGQPTNQFPGLEPTQSAKLIKDAQDAVLQAQRQYANGIKNVKINIAGRGSYSLQVGSPAVDIPDVQCQDFMSPKQCQLLFNVCDPVICPSSRCDFGGTFPVTDVVQSGIIGSTLLCLPNFREGIYVPVCLTGIKAGIDGYLSVLTSYRDCLQESLETGQTVGICDEIYSIRLCDFFWRNALPLAKLIIPKTLEFIMGQNVRGGGEYMGVQASWQNAEKSVNYITQYYAANSYKAFKARLSEGVTESVCQNFVSASYPDGGKIIDAITDPDSPPQFHGRFDEIPFTDAVNPPISHYKVFYHVYAGKDSRAYYKVYLKNGLQSSYYQDTNANLYVASGYIEKGGYASETKDFTATSGYKELCINVNGQEECGFKEVTTSAALDYIKDNYIAEQAKEKQVTTEAECVSGSASLYSGLNLNAQAAAEEILNPAIYNRGIIRVCATANPGQGSDANAGSDGSRWVPVGYCGNQKMICWLDTSNLKSLINSKTIENSVLEEQNKNYQEILKNSGNYLDEAGFSQSVVEIKKKEIPNERIQLINTIIEKVFWQNQKGFLYLLRARAFSEMAINAKDLVDQKKKDLEKGIYEIDLGPSALDDKNPFIYYFTISNFPFTASFDKKSFGFQIKEEKSWLGFDKMAVDTLVGFASPETGIIIPATGDTEAIKRMKWLGNNYLFLNGDFVDKKTANDDERNKNAVRGFKIEKSGEENKINYFGEYSDLYIKDNQIFYSGGRDKPIANVKNGKIQPIADLINLGFPANVFGIILKCSFSDGKFVYGGEVGGSEGAGYKINEEDYYTGGEGFQSCELDITQYFVVEESISLFDFAKEKSGWDYLWPIWYYNNEEVLENKDPQGGSLKIPAGTKMYPPCFVLPEGTERVLGYHITGGGITLSTAIKNIKIGENYQINLDDVKNLNPILSKLDNLDIFPDEVSDKVEGNPLFEEVDPIESNDLLNKWISIPLVKKVSTKTSEDISTEIEEESFGYINGAGFFVVEKDTNLEEVANEIYGDKDYWPILYYANEPILLKAGIDSSGRILVKKDLKLIIIEDVPSYDKLNALGFEGVITDTILGTDGKSLQYIIDTSSVDEETIKLFNPSVRNLQPTNIFEYSHTFVIPFK